jgi:hypothetical protein
MSHCLAWWGPWEAFPEDVGNDLEEWARSRVKRFAAALGRAA